MPIPRPSRAAQILAGLGFDEETPAAPLREFSGGWRMRVALAAVLFTAPDILLLDEPTNYLDLEGTLWLESFLATYPHTVLIVSHDRDLLNKCVGFILHLTDGKLTLYTGGYDDFEETLARAAAPPAQAEEEAGRCPPAYGRVRRALPRQGVEGHPGAEPAEGAGQDAAHRRRDRK